MAGGCEMLHMLKSLFAHNNNTDVWNDAIEEADNCEHNNTTTPSVPLTDQDADMTEYGVLLYAFLTPIIILVGLVGNIISLRVFFSRSLRKLSASVYLAAISISDIMVLLIYVFLGWLKNGLKEFPGEHHLDLIDKPGICETFLYFSYLFRFVSVWLIVVFTIERYIAACRPLQRRVICTKSFGRRAIMFVFCLGSLISLFKPLISGVYPVSHNGYDSGNHPMNSAEIMTSNYVCKYNPDYAYTNFVMEVTYCLLITALPFIVIAFFNVLILRTLMQRDANIKKWKLHFKDSHIRWEFTITLLVVSSTFVALNLPYFVFWCQRFLLTSTESTAAKLKTIDTIDQFQISRTIFYLNYCINFFLYCLTGTYYRRELWAIFCCAPEPFSYHPRGSLISSSTATTQLKDMSRM